MAVDLADYVDTLRREVTPPGSTLFSSVPDEDMVGYMADAFWEIRLDGFMEPYSCDQNGVILPSDDAQVVAGDTDYAVTAFDPSVDLGRQDIALICLYAGIKIIRNRLMSTSSRTKAQAGPVSFEQDFSANLMVEMLKELSATKQRLLFLKTYNQDVSLIDAFSVRSSSAASYSGYLYDWYGSQFGVGPYDDILDPSGII